MRVTNQGGSLAGFIIIGVLLTLMLVGGLYGLNRYNAQKAADEVATSEETATDSPESTNSEEAAAPGDPEATGRERTDSSTATQAPASSAPAATGGSGAATRAQLPQTGPADTFGTFAALGLLTFVGTHYARSRG